MKLSPYTIASNCTDIYDCNTGLDELYEAYDHYKKTGKKEPAYIWSRVEKLEAKRDKCSLKEHGMKYNDYLLSLDLGITEDISQGIDEELISMKERIADWSSEEAINKAKGKTREQIFEMFGIELFPIAYIPRFFAKLLDDKLENFYVYCSKGYFIDHIVNHHPNIDAKKYLLIQDILNEPDEIKETLVNNRQSYVFIKKIDRFSAVVVGIEITDDNRMILHKSFFDQKKKPYANVGKRLYIFTSEGGDLPHLQGCSSIIRTSKKAHGRSLPALDVSNAKIINNSHNTNNYKENLQGVSKTFPFAKHIAQLYEKGEKLDWKKAQKIAKDFDIETDTEIMQACELGCVLEARRIAQNGNSLAQQYEEMKDLYDRQVNIKPLDTKSKVLNQYSTPCPIAYLLGTFVNQNSKMNDGKILEPSAGNGLLTTVFNPEDVCVNELDEIRVENLRKLGFYNVANIDASEKTLLDNEYQDKSFRGIITNPPFAKLPSDKKIQRNGWEINTLDYKMAVLALDKMHDDGRASIIVGGKMWNSYWKPLNETSQKQVLFGQWKTFLGYLYAQYNVVDVIYVDGDNIYRKQGTQYPIAIILIDGRHAYNEDNKPRYVFDPEKDVIIETYDQLYDRLKQDLFDTEFVVNNGTFTYKPQNYTTIKDFKEKYPFGTLVDSVLYNNKIVGKYSFDIENNEIFKESYSIPLDILFREKQGREATERELIYFGKKYAKMGFYVDKSIFFGTKKDEFEKFIKSEFSIVKTSDEEAKRKRAKALLLLAQAKIKIAEAELIIKKNI